MIYIVQNIFHEGRETRNISLNAHYIVLFKSLATRQTASLHLSLPSKPRTRPRVYEKLRGSDKSSTWISHAWPKADYRWQTTARNLTFYLEKITYFSIPWTSIFKSNLIDNLPSSMLCGELGSTDEANCTSTTYEDSWHQMKRVPFTLMNYISAHFQSFQNQLQNQLPFDTLCSCPIALDLCQLNIILVVFWIYALKIIFKLNFRVS